MVIEPQNPEVHVCFFTPFENSLKVFKFKCNNTKNGYPFNFYAWFVCIVSLCKDSNNFNYSFIVDPIDVFPLISSSTFVDSFGISLNGFKFK